MSLRNIRPSDNAIPKHLAPGGMPSTPLHSGDARASLPASDLIQECIDYFTRHLYAVQPIVDRATIEYALRRMDTNAGSGPRHLLWAICAYVLLHPKTDLSGPQQVLLCGKDRFTYGKALLELLYQQRTLARSTLDATERQDPGLWCILTPTLTAGARSSLQDNKGAWNDLREATSNAYAYGIFRRQTVSQQYRILHLVLFINERLYALKLLPWEGSLPLTVSPPMEDHEWLSQQRCNTIVNRLVLTYLLVSQVGHHILNGHTFEALKMQWQYLDLDLARGLAWRSDEAQVLETRCLQHWLRAAVCPRARPHSWRPTTEWRDVVIAILQDAWHLIGIAKNSNRSHVLDLSNLCDIAFFGLDALPMLEASWPESGTQLLAYVDLIVAETGEMMKSSQNAHPSIVELLCDARSKITSIQVSQQAIISCVPAHFALNDALIDSSPGVGYSGSGVEPYPSA
ncbi:hypothetical protein M409DRAFT_61645 [Zasmidium cellare ATCC 36951]|uniref:Transcription factor domain-containing protein n=1 Tax=Zasmidium cellare ATCC 36951 TaxID=1080233 RepID=A0A6A6BY11_ZASCE|nr:uncharacterized protein M409DRAFT_61645 [Zasmidium cellare ATCC 36951]KAF2158442.1 hypothetical protein M409DRAFT_61645 [Zasmidium cellare ATCC 36951]